MNKAIFITARLGSSRLPSKHLLEIEGNRCIDYVIERAKLVPNADFVVMCTTNLDQDDKLRDIALEHNILVCRGSVKDKIDRWCSAAKRFDVDFFVTADADDLFCSPRLMSLAFEQYDRTGADLINWESTGIVCGAFSYGVKVEALQKINDTKDTDDTEMMWHFFETGDFKIEPLENIPEIFKRPEIRATLDYREDYEFFKAVISRAVALGLNTNSLEHMIMIIDNNPHLLSINQFRHVDWKNAQEKKISEFETKNPNKYLGNELKYLEKVLNNEEWSSTAGGWCQVLEKSFAERTNSKYAVCFNSGTSTLHAALEAVGVSYGDEVIIPALTVMMDTATVLHANAIPVYADVDPETFNIDPEDVEKKITDKTKAIMAVALYGLPPDLTALREIANRYGIALIEDNAQCFFGKCDGQIAGSFGDIASYSFENTKHISCGEGGIITTNNAELAELCRKIGGNGFKNLRAEEGRIRLNPETFQNPNYKRHDVLGWNYRLSEFNAAVVLGQLERSETLVDFRIQSANFLIQAMKGSIYFKPQVTPPGYKNVYYTLGVLYTGDEAGVPWEDFRKRYVELGGDGIYAAWSLSYLEPVITSGQYKHRCPDLYNDLEFPMGLCPLSEDIQPRLMQFKTNYRDLDLAKRKADILAKTIEEFGL